MKIAIVAITKDGYTQACRIKEAFPGSRLYILKKLGKRKGAVLFDEKLIKLSEKLFIEFEGIVFCMASGIVVRAIAPYLKDKFSDPAVVVVDDSGRFAVSLLSGHEGGANNLAIKVSNILGAEPVVTTSSESKKNIVLGMGCRRGIARREIIKAVKYALAKTRYSLDKVRHIATVDIKQNEPGLKKACLELGVPLRIVSLDLIKHFNGKYQRSSFVKAKIGIEGVSEPCALLTAKRPKLILPKIKVGMVTVAIAEEH